LGSTLKLFFGGKKAADKDREELCSEPTRTGYPSLQTKDLFHSLKDNHS